MQILTQHQLDTLRESIEFAREFVDQLYTTPFINPKKTQEFGLDEEAEAFRVKTADALRLVRILQSNADIPELKKDFILTPYKGSVPPTLDEVLAPVLAEPDKYQHLRHDLEALIATAKEARS